MYQGKIDNNEITETYLENFSNWIELPPYLKIINVSIDNMPSNFIHRKGSHYDVTDIARGKDGFAIFFFDFPIDTIISITFTYTTILNPTRQYSFQYFIKYNKK